MVKKAKLIIRRGYFSGNKGEYIGVDYEGHNEGFGYPCTTAKRVEEAIIEAHIRAIKSNLKLEIEINLEPLKPKVYIKEKGIFCLNNVNIQWKFKNEDGLISCEIESIVDRKPNLLTETGYRSLFTIIGSLKEGLAIKEIVELSVRNRLEDEKVEEYTLIMEKGEEVKQIVQEILF